MKDNHNGNQLLLNWVTAFLAQTSDMMFVKDSELVYVAASEPFARMVGLASADEVVGKTDFDLFADRSLARRYVDDDRRMIANGKPLVPYIEPLPEQNGRPAWTRTQKGLIWDDGGTMIGVYGIGVDITERVELEQSKTLLNSVPGAAFRCKFNAACDILVANDGFYRFVGYSAEEFSARCGDSLAEIIHPLDKARFLESLAHPPQTGVTIHDTYRIVRRDGNVRWITLQGIPGEMLDGEKTLFCTFMDSTAEKETELALRTEQQKIELALHDAHIIVWEYDLATQTITQQQDQEQYRVRLDAEHAAEIVAGKGFIHPDFMADFMVFYDKLRGGEPEAEARIRVYTADGKLRWYRNRMKTIYDEAGKPLRVVGFGMDITSQVEAEERYAEFQSYQKVAAKNVYASIRLNLTANICYASSANNAEDLADSQFHTVDEYWEFTNRFICDPALRRELSATLSRPALLDAYAKGVATYEYDVLYEFMGSGCRWVHSVVEVMENPHTHDVEALAYCLDINEDKINAEIIKKVTAAEYDYIAMINLNTEEHRLYLGSSNDTLMPEEGVGQNYSKVLEDINRRCIHPEDLDRSLTELSTAEMRENLKKTNLFSAVYRIYDKSGGLRYKKMQYTWLDESAGQVILTRSDVTDVVKEQSRQQELLQEALSKAEQASRAKSDFLSRMSHEIRTPMNAIIGLSRLGGELAVVPEARQYFSDIYTSGEFLLGLINDILDMSRIEQGRMELHEEYVNGPEFLRGIEVVVQPVASARNIRIRTDLTKAQTPWVKMDKLRSQQIYINILNNAIKFSPPGSTVEWTVEDTILDETHMHMVSTIRDRGCGMSEEFLSHLFEPFSQEHNQLVDERKGTGLGLAIVKSVIDAIGGTIRVESELGKGTTFVFELTREYASAPPAGFNPPAESIDFTGLTGRTALLCEDHPLNMKIAVKLLEKVGMTVLCAENGQLGVSAFANSKPGAVDAILMDIRMPVMDGLEATRAIRSLDRVDAGTVPIIAMTANAFDEDIQKGRDAGMNAHLSKPIDPQKLYHVLAEYMGITARCCRSDKISNI